MSCKVNVRQVGDVVVIDLSGRVTLGEGSGAVRNCIKQQVDSDRKKILINLEDVSYIDSSGLGELVGAYATVGHRGGAIKLLNAQKSIRDLLQVTKLYTVFEVFEDEAAAIRSFGPQSTTV